MAAHVSTPRFVFLTRRMGQAREVFQESKKLSTGSSIPKAPVISSCADRRSVLRETDELQEERATRLKSFLKRLEQDERLGPGREAKLIGS